ncbi:uncharacterized protein METZ01_LOCUS51180 [marine metagenome]|uniref:DUF1552 domain-containing protein n=1 Tax=marine metagenome TaxID=408172 RepID=A0A381S2K0_9ZZZZ
MVPAFAAIRNSPANPVRRFGVVYVPNGMAMKHWTPEGEGQAFEVTRLLNPISDYRDQMTLLTGLNGVPSNAGVHASAATRFLTGVTPARTESNLRAGISVDQLIAKEFAQHTQLGSLELALDSRDVSGSCDVGFSCTYTNTISWRNETTPLLGENNPRAVFERLFGDSGSTDPAARLARIHKDQSILDSVTDKIDALQRGLGPNDRLRVNEYLDAVRDIERRIQKAEEQSDRELPEVDQPAGIPATYEEHAKLMFDLLLLAYQTDLTRVSTYMMAREISGRTYPEIGVPDSHHPTSHHRDDPTLYEKVAKINEFHLTLFSHFLEKARATQDGDGSLLDNMVMIYGAGMSDSNRHDNKGLPLALLGGGSGQLKPAGHVRYAERTPITNLHLTILDKMGIPVEKMSDSTGKLDLLSVG